MASTQSIVDFMSVDPKIVSNCECNTVTVSAQRKKKLSMAN